MSSFLLVPLAFTQLALQLGTETWGVHSVHDQPEWACSDRMERCVLEPCRCCQDGASCIFATLLQLPMKYPACSVLCQSARQSASESCKEMVHSINLSDGICRTASLSGLQGNMCTSCSVLTHILPPCAHALLQNPRNAKPVVGRNYTTAAGFQEPWWLLATTYYAETISNNTINPNAYLDQPIR